MIRIDRLSMENFGCFKDATIDLKDAKLVMIGGDVGAGKTMILDGIRTIFEGTARGYAKKDVGLLSNGGEAFRVEAHVATPRGTGILRRTTSGALSAIGKDGKVLSSVKVEQLKKMLGVADLSLVGRTLDVMKAYEMTAAERRQMALDVSGEKPTEEFLREKGLHTDELVVLALAGKWASAHRRAVELKRAANREYKAQEADKPHDPEITWSGKTFMASEAKPEKIEKFDEEIRKQRRKAGRIRNEIAQAEAGTSSRVEGLAAVLKEKEKELATSNMEGLLGTIEAHKASLEEAEEIRKENAPKLAKLVEDRDKASHDLYRATGRVTDVKKCTGTHECTICGLEHEGVVPEGGLEKAEKEKAAAEKKLKSVETKLKKITKLMKEKAQAIAEYQETAIRLGAKVRQLEQMERDILKIKGQLSEEKERLKNAATAEQIADKKEAALGIDAWCEGAQEVVDTIRQYHRSVVRYESIESLAEKVRLEAKSFEEQEMLCDLKAEDSIPSQMFQKLLDGLQEKLDFWHEQGLMKHRVTVDGEFELWVEHGPVKVLSGSERWRVGLAVAAAIAEMAGLGFMAVDEVDRLPGKAWRKRMIIALMKLLNSGRFSQVFVTMAVDSPLPASGRDDIAVLHIDAETHEIARAG